MSSKQRAIGLKVLSGEPTDGGGRVCIHLFIQDERGPFVEPHALRPALDEHGMPIKQRLVSGPARGRLACDPKRSPAPVTRKGVIDVTPRTDDPRAVTCLKCEASKEYLEMMEKLALAEAR